MYESLTRLIPGLIEEYGIVIVDNESKGTMDDPIRMPFVDYSLVVTELMKAVYAFKAEHPDFKLTKYEEILNSNGLEWSLQSMNEADVSDADGKLIMALLMGAIRADRFSEGTLLGFCEDGSVLRWLKRLKEIDDD